MENERKTYKAKFGELMLRKGPEDDFAWMGTLELTDGIFAGQIPVCIFTKTESMPEAIMGFVESLIADVIHLLDDAILFAKSILTEQKEQYKIKENEYALLDLGSNDFPLDSPELVFWEASSEWMIRFAEGGFEICDPFGISVVYNLTQPVRIENLEDSDFIEE